MLTDEDIDAVPEDASDEEAFVILARTAQRKADSAVYSDDDRISITPYVIDYFSAIRAAAHAYEMTELGDIEVPDPSDSDILQQYQRFQPRVQEFVLRLKLARKRNVPLYSVALDGAAKAKIHALLDQIRSEVDAADLDLDKKNALFDAISKLACEVDKNRTGFQRSLAYMMALMPIGDGVSRIVARILGLYNEQKSNEERVLKSLRPPRAKSALPAPSRPKRPSTISQDLEDEIPF